MCLYFSHLSNFVIFTFNTISILNISHCIFFTTLVMYHCIILLFHFQNFSFSQILSSIDIWHPLGLTPRLFRPAHGFYVYSFQFFQSFSFYCYSLFFTFFSFFLILVVFTSVIFRILFFLHLTLFLFSVSLISFFKRFSSF